MPSERARPLSPVGALTAAISRLSEVRPGENLVSARFGEYAEGGGTYYALAFQRELHDKAALENLDQTREVMEGIIMRAFEVEYMTERRLVHNGGQTR